MHGHFLDDDPAAVCADDELAGKDVLVDEACPNDVEQGQAPESLETVRVRPTEAEEQPEQGRIGDARCMPDKGSLIGRAYGEFAPDDQIGLAGLENVDGMSVKVGVA